MRLIQRVFMIVLDGCGVGELPEAIVYGDCGSNTIGNTARAVGGLHCPYLERLGLGKVIPVVGMRSQLRALGGFGKMAECSAGKDSTSGHWELAGLVTARGFPTYPRGFPPEVIGEFVLRTGYGVIGNIPASGTEIIRKLGKQHLSTGKLIVYTSGDSVFQIAAHIDKVPLEELYRICSIAREMLVGKHGVARVIARPFTGETGRFVRTADRRDFSLPPTGKTILDCLQWAGIRTTGVGKIDDLFAGAGLDQKIHTRSNADGMDKTITLAESASRGFIFVNIVEFDMLWGHRNDPFAFAGGLEDFDRRLGELLPLLSCNDLLLITADHGCDPTTASTDHSREYVPILTYSPAWPPDISLGVRASFADVAATIAEIFNVEGTGAGESFWPLLTSRQGSSG